jgi:hypothetical protein
LNEGSNSPSLFLWQKYVEQKDTIANLTKLFYTARVRITADEFQGLSEFQPSVQIRVIRGLEPHGTSLVEGGFWTLFIQRSGGNRLQSRSTFLGPPWLVGFMENKAWGNLSTLNFLPKSMTNQWGRMLSC